MRRERLYLDDVVSAADAVAVFISELSKDEFLANDLVRSGVMYQLVIIGEASARIGSATRAAHPQIP